MALTKVSTDGVKDDAVTTDKLANAINTERTANTAKVSTTINNNADNRVITGSGTANTLEGEASLTFDGTTLKAEAANPVLELSGTAGTSGNTFMHINANANHWCVGADNFSSQNLFVIKSGTPASSTHRFAIDSSGRVGIGTTSPIYKLHLNESTSGNNYIHFTNSDTGTSASDGAQIGIDGGESLILWQRENNSIRFATNNTERLRILAGGGLTFNGDTAEANALDDYEEGYWSPTAVDGKTLHLQNSGNVAARRYIKIGKLVTCFFDINFDSGNSSPNFRTRFSGLPFSKESTSEGAGGALTISYFDGSETDMLVGHTSSANLMEFFENGDGLYSYSESAGDRIAGYFTYVTT